MALLIKDNCTGGHVAPVNGIDFDFSQVRPLIDAEIIEIIHCKEDGLIMLIDEEGKFKPEKHKPKYIASQMVESFEGDLLAGSVLVCKDSEVR